MTKRPRNIASDIIDAVESATSKWTRQKKSDASVDVIGPSGGLTGVLFCEKEGFGPLFKEVNLADRFDLMIISTKGVSVTAARRLIDHICGGHHIPLFVLHDFDVAGFLILGTLQRDTRRYQFTSGFEVVDLGLRLEDIDGLEQEPAAASKTGEDILRRQLAENGATDEEIDILVDERVELNAMASDELVEMIERKLKDYGLEKVIPNDGVLKDVYEEFHRSNELREKFDELEEEFDKAKKDTKIKVPRNLKKRVGDVLKEHPHLRWDDAIWVLIDPTDLDDVETKKQEAKEKSGDFTGANDDEAGKDDE